MLTVSPTSLLGNILKTSGPAFFLAIQGSSLKTAFEIQDNRSVGLLSPVPFLTLFVNCTIWSIYGIRKKDMTIFAPNAIGVLSGLICSGIYHQNMGDKKPNQLYFLVAALILIASTSPTATVGYLGCALAIGTTGSPLATLKTVLQTKSTEALPFLTSFLMFCNAIGWSSYGILLAKDPFVTVPNLVGLALAIVQLSMFGLFGFPTLKKNSMKKLPL